MNVLVILMLSASLLLAYTLCLFRSCHFSESVYQAKLFTDGVLKYSFIPSANRDDLISSFCICICLPTSLLFYWFL